VGCRGCGGSDLDLNIDPGRQVQFPQLINGFGRWLDDIKQAFVGPDFELFHRLFIDVRGAVHGEFFNPGGKRDRAGHPGSGALGGLDDFASGLIQHAKVESLEANAYTLSVHVCESGLLKKSELA